MCRETITNIERSLDSVSSLIDQCANLVMDSHKSKQKKKPKKETQVLIEKPRRLKKVASKF